jgi:hypothetical protein
MKKYILVIGTIFLIFFLSGCENESDHHDADRELTYIKTKAGGCNGQNFDGLKSVSYEQNDTVVFSVKNDTLDIYVGVNYICCAPFESEAVISNDSILMNLTDTCSDMNNLCYCRCMCYYTWDFLFTDFMKKEYYFKILLDDPHENNPIVFKEGVIDFSMKN